MKKNSKITLLANEIAYRSKGVVNGTAKVKKELLHLAKPTLINYYQLPVSAQIIVNMSKSIQGKLGVKQGVKGGFVFQMSNGTQQIKLYNPDNYTKNAENTPLRKRARQIMQLCHNIPVNERRMALKELYRTLPYYLYREKEVKLRMKNFYFQKEPIRDTKIRIYKTTDKSLTNTIDNGYIAEKGYGAKKEIKFEYNGDRVEFYYAVNTATGERSNVLEFIWEDEFEPTVKVISLKYRLT